jgi:hypothetical protein
MLSPPRLAATVRYDSGHKIGPKKPGDSPEPCASVPRQLTLLPVGLEKCRPIANKPKVEDALRVNEAETAAYYGFQRKHGTLGQSVTLALNAKKRETAANYEAAAALREALFGNTEESWQRAEAALALSAGRDTQFGAGWPSPSFDLQPRHLSWVTTWRSGFRRIQSCNSTICFARTAGAGSQECKTGH